MGNITARSSETKNEIYDFFIFKERVEAVLEAFRPGRERERDRTQLLSPAHQPDGVKQEGGSSSSQQQPPTLLPAVPAAAYIATASATAVATPSAATAPPAHTTTTPSLSA